MSSTNSPLLRIAKGAGFIFFGMIISKFLNYFYRIIVARYLGPTDYGLLSLGFAVIGIIVTLGLLGIPQGIVRYVAYYMGKQDKRSINGILFSSLKITIPLAILLGVLVFVLSDWIAVTFFSKPALGNLLRILAMAIPLLVLINNFEKMILAFQKVQYNIFSRSIIENLLKVVVTFVFVMMGFGVLWATSAYIFSLFSGLALLVWFLQKKVYSLKEIFTNHKDMFKVLLTFSLPLLLTELFASLLIWTDTLILGHYLSSSFVGIYNAAVPTAMLVYIVPTTIRTIFYPVMSEEYAKNNNVVRIFKLGSNFILFLTLPVAAFLIIFADKFLLIFFGDVYVQGAGALIIICASYFIYALANTSHIMLFVLKKTKLILFNTAVSVIVNIVLNIVLIPKYGLIGAAIATGTSLIVRTLMILVEGKYLIRALPFSWRSVLPFVVIIVPSVISVWLLDYVNSFIWLLVASITFGALYLFLLWFLRFFRKEEINMIKRLPIPFLKN